MLFIIVFVRPLDESLINTVTQNFLAAHISDPNGPQGDTSTTQPGGSLASCYGPSYPFERISPTMPQPPHPSPQQTLTSEQQQQQQSANQSMIDEYSSSLYNSVDQQQQSLFASISATTPNYNPRPVSFQPLSQPPAPEDDDEVEMS